MELGMNPGWRERFAELQQVEFEIPMYLPSALAQQLSLEEFRRLQPKLLMVSRAAARMAMNMIKGTIKYSVDTWTPEVWAEMAIDDATDTLNYLHLLKEALNGSSEK